MNHRVVVIMIRMEVATFKLEEMFMTCFANLILSYLKVEQKTRII